MTTFREAKAKGLAREFMRVYRNLVNYLDQQPAADVHRWFWAAAGPVQAVCEILENRQKRRLLSALADLADLFDDPYYTVANSRINGWYNSRRLSAVRAAEYAADGLREILAEIRAEAEAGSEQSE